MDATKCERYIGEENFHFCTNENGSILHRYGGWYGGARSAAAFREMAIRHIWLVDGMKIASLGKT